MGDDEASEPRLGLLGEDHRKHARGFAFACAARVAVEIADREGPPWLARRVCPGTMPDVVVDEQRFACFCRDEDASLARACGDDDLVGDDTSERCSEARLMRSGDDLDAS